MGMLQIYVILTNKSRATGSFNISDMFTILKKRRLKNKIYKEFIKARSEKNWEMVDILGKRYLSL